MSPWRAQRTTALLRVPRDPQEETQGALLARLRPIVDNGYGTNDHGMPMLLVSSGNHANNGMG